MEKCARNRQNEDQVKTTVLLGVPLGDGVGVKPRQSSDRARGWIFLDAEALRAPEGACISELKN